MPLDVEVVGDGPGAGVHALAAEDAGLVRVARDGGLVVVAPSAPDPTRTAAAALARGAVVVLDPPVTAADLSVLVDLDAGHGRLHLGDHARFSPGWTVATAPSPGDQHAAADHVSVVITRPATDGEGDDPLLVLGPGALAAAEALAGDLVVDVEVVRRTTGVAEVRLRLAGGGSGTAQLTFGTDALWQAQVASADRVVTVELAPTTLVERNGEPVLVPPGPRTRDARLVDLGYLGQLAAVAAGAATTAVDDDLRRLRLLAAADA